MAQGLDKLQNTRAPMTYHMLALTSPKSPPFQGFLLSIFLFGLHWMEAKPLQHFDPSTLESNPRPPTPDPKPENPNPHTQSLQP